MIVNHTGFGIFYIDIVAQINEAAVRNNVKNHPGRFHCQHQSAKRHLIQGFMDHILLENHGGIQRTLPGQRHHAGLYPKSGGNTGKTGQFAFFIADVPAAVAKFHGAVGYQLDDFRFLILVSLASFDGQGYFLLHQNASCANASRLSMSWL